MLTPLLLALAMLPGRSAVGQAARAPFVPADLRCERLVTPLAEETQRPRLSWRLLPADPNVRGIRQTRYRIRVASTEARLASGRADMWDSGIVASSKTIGVRYAGEQLLPCRRYVWSVTAWDQSGASAAARSWWETGPMRQDDWHARWLRAPGDPAKPKAGPMPLFRHEFTLRRVPLKARLYVCGLGHAEARINGRKVAESVLDPGWTNYKKTCLFVPYDVTNLLSKGPNCLGILLGNGMYNVPGGRYVKFTGSLGPPKVIAQLVLDMPGGRRVFIGTDGSWQTAPGPITFSCVYGGEDHDARLERRGWDRPGAPLDEVWEKAVVTDGPGGALRPQMTEPIVALERLAPVAVTEPKPGVTLYDFGKNMSAMPSLRVQGPAGARVRLIPAERLSNGLADQGQSGGPSYFEYTLRGGGIEEWEPRFTYYGCRWLQVEGAQPDSPDAPRDKPVVVGLALRVVAPKIERTGWFATSDPLLNGIHTLIDRAIISNTKSVLTDCPHREKLGWLEQDYLVGPGLFYNYRMGATLEKVLRDIREAQTPEGLVPDIAPEYTVFSGGFRDSPEWGAAYALCSQQLAEFTGDTWHLQVHRRNATRYADYLVSKAKNGLLDFGLGDWADVGTGKTPMGVTATAIGVETLRATAEMCRAGGQEADARRLEAEAEKMREAFSRTFRRPDGPGFCETSQTANAMALALNVAADNERAGALEALIADIARLNGHTSAGDIGFRYELLALAQAGRSDLVLDMLLKREHPSYGYQIDHGATSLTEAWDGPTRGWSQNHFMLGHADEWFYGWLAGIRPTAPGFSTFLVRPYVDRRLDWVAAQHNAPHGTIAVRWEVKRETVTLDVTVPPNTVATIWAPGADAREVRHAAAVPAERIGVREGCTVFRAPSGRYSFTAPMPPQRPAGAAGKG